MEFVRERCCYSPSHKQVNDDLSAITAIEVQEDDRLQVLTDQICKQMSSRSGGGDGTSSCGACSDADDGFCQDDASDAAIGDEDHVLLSDAINKINLTKQKPVENGGTIICNSGILSILFSPAACHSCNDDGCESISSTAAAGKRLKRRGLLPGRLAASPSAGLLLPLCCRCCSGNLFLDP